MRRALGLAFLFALSPMAALATDTLPQTLDSCPLSQTEFNGWFQSGTAAPNGIVKPANSIAFNPASNCDFYKWSEQMWLWATSPAPSGYGGGGLVFTSPTFFDVTPPDPNDPNHMRSLIPHTSVPPFIANGLERAGQERLPILEDVSGGVHDVVFAPAAQDGNSLIRSDAGEMIEIGRIETSKKGKAVFFDTSDNKIDARARLTFDLLPATVTGPLNAYIQSAQNSHLKDLEAFRVKVVKTLMTKLEAAPVVEAFRVAGIPTIVNTTNNNVVLPMTEVTEAGGNNVLVAQNHELIYFGIHVNDVYAYYLKGRKTGLIAPAYTQPTDTGFFPTTQADFNAIQAAFPTKNFPDSVALAIEMKTAWINAASLPDPQNYIRRSIRVTVYDKTNPLVWIPTGTQVIQLALLSAHVVGSTNGPIIGGVPSRHREMLWGTYEHVNNSPHARYNWTTPGNVSVLEPLNTGPNTPPWLFYDNTGSTVCPGTANCNHAQAQLAANGNIIGLPTTSPVLPSEVMRTMAFGAAANQQPNPLASPERSNDEVIALNNHVQSMLPDVRTKYVFTGSTWTFQGAPPSGRYTGGAPLPGSEVGTSVISNSLLETYVQGNVALVGTGAGQNPSPFNCFSCHGSNTTDVSHIFNNTNPF